MLANSVTSLTENTLGNPIRRDRLPYKLPHKAYSGNVYRYSLPPKNVAKKKEPNPYI
jgi:hypothetical protein